MTRGGATAFPRLGTAVWPAKGTAAFWYNLKRSGRGALVTLHGACPVVHGSKWGEHLLETLEIFYSCCVLSYSCWYRLSDCFLAMFIL